MFEPRPYQSSAIDSVLQAVAEDWTGRYAVVLPTGTGKTVIFSHLAREMRDYKPLILVHRDELVRQTQEKVNAVFRQDVTGVIKAERHEIDKPVTIASVQSLSRQSRLDRTPNAYQFMIIDEAHHSVAASYKRIIEWHGPNPIVGFSATFDRTDTKKLGEIWTDVVYKKDIIECILSGYLTDVIGKRVIVDEFDLNGIDETHGDWTDSSLAREMMKSCAHEIAAKAYTDHAQKDDGSYRSAIAFCPTVETARQFAETFNSAGIKTATVVGETAIEDRQEIYRAHRLGDVKVISSCAVLTEGFDAPWIECIINARPTQSDILYTQMIGRGLRPFPGKRDCLVLDITGTGQEGRLRTIANLAKLRFDDDDYSDVEDMLEAGTTLTDLSDWIDGRDSLSRARPKSLRHEDFEIFDRSDAVWNRTYKGTWFIRGKRYVWVLAEVGNAWNVGRYLAGTKRSDARWLVEGLSDIEMAMTYAASLALEQDPTIVGGGKRWRKGWPSEKTIAFAERLRIPHEGLRAGQLSSAISVKLTSRELGE